MKMLAATNPCIRKAVNVLERLSMSDEIVAEYEERLKAEKEFNYKPLAKAFSEYSK